MASAVTLTLLLTGCATEQDEHEHDEVEQEADAESTAPEEHVLGPAECLVGSWRVDNARFEEYLNSLGTGVSMAVSGANYLRFDDEGKYFTWREDFTFTMGSGEQTVTHVSNSGETGDYGTVLEWGGASPSDFLWVAETMTVVRDEVYTVGGIAQVVDDGAADMTITLFDGYTGEVPRIEDREAVEGSGPFTCDADTLTLGFDIDSEMLYHRAEASGG